jgi:hypothetical protein
MTWPVVTQKFIELQPFKKHFAECMVCNNFTPTIQASAAEAVTE